MSIEGLPEMPIEDLRLSNIVANAREGLRAFNTRGLELHNVRVNADSGIPFLIRDSTNLDLDGVQTRAPKADTPVVRLDRDKMVWLRNSVAWPGTGVFLSLPPGMQAAVSMIADDLSAASARVREEEEDAWKAIATPDRPATRPR